VVFEELGYGAVTTSMSTFKVEGRAFKMLLGIIKVQDELNQEEKGHLVIDWCRQSLEIWKREKPEEKKRILN